MKEAMIYVMLHICFVFLFNIMEEIYWKVDLLISSYLYEIHEIHSQFFAKNIYLVLLHLEYSLFHTVTHSTLVLGGGG